MGIIDVTWDAVNKGSGVILSNGNLTAKVPNYNNTVRATHGKSHGKWYWEITISVYNWLLIGIVNRDSVLTSSNSSTQNARYYWENGKKLPENVLYGNNFVVGDVISILLNLDSGTLEFWKNGVSQGISHTNIKTMGEVFPAVSAPQSGTTESTVTANFGATPFKYQMPVGFYSYDGKQKNWGHKVLFKSKIGEAISIINRNAIPQMTSYTTPNGKVEDSGNILTWEGVSYSGWNLFNKLNHWVTVNTTTGWVSYEFETPKKIVQYILTAPSLDANLNRMAKDWEVLAFDARSNSWILLDKQTSQMGWKTLEKRIYKLNIENNYKKYKFNVTANNGAASNLQVFRLELLEAHNSLDCLINDEILSSNFEKYGMIPDLIASDIKNSINKKRLIATKSKVFDMGKTFEHEIDLKKYEVNKILLGITS